MARERSQTAAMRLLAVAVAVAVTCACVGVSIASGTTPKLRVVYVEDRGVVQPGKTDGANEACPKKAPHAIAGYFGTDSQADAPAVTVTNSGPYGKGNSKWTISVKGLSDQQQSYFVGAVCASGGPYPVVFDTGTVEAGQTDGFVEKCPRSAPNAVSGFAYPRAEDTGQLVLAASGPVAHGWNVVVKNTGTTPQAYVAGAVCAGKKMKVDFLRSGQLSVDPGKFGGTDGKCGKRTPHAVGGLFAIPEASNFGDVTIGASYPSGSSGRMWSSGVANTSATAQQYFVGAVCLG